MRLDVRNLTPKCYDHTIKDNKTGEILKGVIMADDEVGEYLQYIDIAGGCSLEEALNKGVVSFGKFDEPIVHVKNADISFVRIDNADK